MYLSDTHLEKIHRHKELLITVAVIFICLTLSLYFPVANAIQSISRGIFFLVLIPIFYIKFILKNNLAEWGWNIKNPKIGAILATIAFISAIIIFFILIRTTGFLAHYHISPLAKNSFGLFLLYELVFFNFFFFTREFFFKCFVLFSFKQFSFWSVFIQSGIYFALLIISKNFSWQTTPLMFVSIIGGWITFKTRSFAYSYIFGLLFIMILDVYVIHLVK